MNTPGSEELRSLIELLCEADLSPEQHHRLEELLLQSDDAQWLYIDYLHLHAVLNWDAAYLSAVEGPVLPVLSGAEGSKAEGSEAEGSEAEGPTPPLVASSPRPPVAPSSQSPVLGFLAGISRHVPGGEFTVGSLLLLVIVAAFWGLSQAILFPRLGGHHLAEDSSRPATAPSSPRNDTVATIRETSDVEWSPESKSPLAPGYPVQGVGRGAGGEGAAIAKDSPLSIQSGLIELELKQGTTLLIEGPADWKINGENSATLTHGKLVAKVPQQAIGFTLETPTAKIIDLGTEFGVEVANDGAADVHVVKGLIDVQSANQSSNRFGPGKLEAGQSVQISPAGNKVQNDTTLPDKFKRLVEAGEKKGQMAGSPLARWREASQKLRTDSSLVAYYDFESQGKQLQNVLADKLHGDIITERETAPWIEGRWRGKRALAFGKDFANVGIPDDSSLTTKGDWTFAVWFRVDAIPSAYSPILVKGYPSRNYSLWLQADGALHTSTFYAAGGQTICISTKPIAINEWNLATGVIDAGKMRLYLNGTEACAPQPMRAGFYIDDQPLLLGRTREAVHPHPFTGVIDELAIYARALSAEEIAEMYRTGKPER